MQRFQLGCGPLELDAYAQMADPNSALSQEGMRLAKLCEQATTLPTYYYLVRHWGREGLEHERVCPGCGGSWSKQRICNERGFGWFDFQCVRCRLVSHIADSEAENDEQAQIGEWPAAKRRL